MKHPGGLIVVSAVLLAFASLAPAATETTASAPGSRMKKIAILANVWNTSCHANVIATKFFTGFPIDTGIEAPKVQIVSIWVAQGKPDDVAHKLAEKFNIPVYPTITEALTLGGKKLAVDGVIYVGEHGDYPPNRFGVKMYPHLSVLEEVFRVFEASGRVVPVYSDKQVAYSWLDAKWIYDRAKELNVPLMGGSVLPVTWRCPALEHPIGSTITEAVAVGYGTLESYGFHVAEILQCMVERRSGGETGVGTIECLRGPAVYEAARAGKFSMELAEAACATVPGKLKGTMEEIEKNPTVVLVSYADGTRGAMLILPRYVGEGWAYAAKVDGRTAACQFVSPPKPIYAYFSYLGLNVQELFLTGKVGYPVERTLLTSGIIDEAVRSLADGKPRTTPNLAGVKYQPASTPPIRPSGTEPTGASIGPWPPAGFEFVEKAKGVK